MARPITHTLKEFHIKEHPVDEKRFDPLAPPIWEVIEAIGKSILEAGWSKVPADLASNLDHYLYGSEKAAEK